VSDWRFSDPRNCAVLVTEGVLRGDATIVFVSRDRADGAWQFHDAMGGGEPKVMSLGQVVELDSTIAELADLPLGWRALRTSKRRRFDPKQNNAGSLPERGLRSRAPHYIALCISSRA